MPQMAPMMWLFLFIIFIITFLFFNILNYFNFMKFNKLDNKMTMNKKSKNIYLTWKW